MIKYICISAVVIAYTLMFVFTIPFQTPDEPEHFETIIWISQGIFPRSITSKDKKPKLIVRDLINLYSWNILPWDKKAKPRFEQIKKSEYQELNAKDYVNARRNIPAISTQSYHPPLYHIVGASFFKLAQLLNLSIINAYYVTRLASLLFYVGIAAVGYYLLRNWYVWTFFALNPLLLRMGVGINNDIAVTFFAVVTLLILKEKRFSAYRVILLSIITAAAVLSKLSGIFLMVPIVFVLRKDINKILIYISAVIVGILPWIISNWQQYHQLIPTYAFSVICRCIRPTPFWQIPLRTIFEFRHSLYHFAGFYGWNDTYPPKIVFVAYGLSLVIAAAAALVHLLKRKETKLYLLFTGALLTFLGSMFAWNLVNARYCDIQGRYLLPIFVIFVYFISKFVSHKSLFLFSLFYILYSIFSILVPRYFTDLFQNLVSLFGFVK